jgi:Flp pilus assembly protein TadG
MRKLYQKRSGQAVIHTLGLLFMTLFLGVLAVDFGFYFTVQQGMRNASDAAALAAVQALFENTSTSLSAKQSAAIAAAQSLSQQNRNNRLNSSDIEFGYVNPVGTYNASTFLTPSNNSAFSLTGGYNAVRVTVKAGSGQANTAIPTIFAKTLRIQSLNAQAQSVAVYGGGANSAGGLRPIYLCQAAWDTAISRYGDPTTPTITFYGSNIRVGNVTVNAANSCGNMGPGNWGLADFTNSNGAPGQSNVQSWFANGYSGRVNVSNVYQSQPGSQLPSYDTELSNLKARQTVIRIPLYSSTAGPGSLAQFQVSQIASFVITDYKDLGSDQSRNISGHFVKEVCPASVCSLGSTVRSGATTRLRLVR